ncbi:hypothetical protein NESM_000793600 [Novymonas esmeraldas]|uniref:Uncharacterized protein n=1 Tax=Novymonas esmeraldas TaxID=1808958 RepID=A0AAW0EVR7_9TRYP
MSHLLTGELQRRRQLPPPRLHHLVPLPHHIAALGDATTGTDSSGNSSPPCAAPARPSPPGRVSTPSLRRESADSATARVPPRLRQPSVRSLLPQPCGPPASSAATATGVTDEHGTPHRVQPPPSTSVETRPVTLPSRPPHAASSGDGGGGSVRGRCYRTPAAQLVHSITRLNRMTAEAGGLADAAAPFIITAGRCEAGVGSGAATRRLARVPLLPLTLCTDGATVVLVDPNGTAQHCNYVHAVDTYRQCRAAVAAPSSSPPTTVLWWSWRDLHASHTGDAVPLATARAALVVGGGTVNVGGVVDTAGAAAAARQAAGPAPLSAVQPERLCLSHGDPMVLVLAGGDVCAGAAAAAAAEDPDVFSLAGDVLRDVYHGYLPTLIESVYPHGGVPLRGCWCGVARDTEEVPSRGTQAPPSAETAIVAVRAPLLPGVASVGSAERATAAAAAHDTAAVMRSLLPSSRPPPAAADSAALWWRSIPPATALHLPRAVMAFMMPEQARLHPTPLVVAAAAAAVAAAVPVDEPHDSYSVCTAADPRNTDGGACRGTGLASPPTAGLTCVSPLLHAPRPPPRAAATATTTTIAKRVCESIVVLTPIGRVELVAPAEAGSAATTTVADVKYSLLRSAAGRSLGMSGEEVAVAYAPGSASLSDATVLDTRHAVLRLRRRLVSDMDAAHTKLCLNPPA